MCTAIITARLGSKRLKKKNIKSFFGRPVIYYPIRACNKSKIFRKIIVSTESKKIAEISKKFKAEIPFLRSKKLSDDKTGTLRVVRNAIKKLKLKPRAVVCCLYPVTPLTTSKTLKKAYKIFKKSKCSFLFPVIKSVKRNRDSFQLNKKNIIRRTNKSRNFYNDAGQFYFGTVNNFLTKNSLHYSGSSKGMILSPGSVVDVNTNNDWKKLKELYRRNKIDAQI